LGGSPILLPLNTSLVRTLLTFSASAIAVGTVVADVVPTEVQLGHHPIENA
jgi:hypothetical protein